MRQIIIYLIMGFFSLFIIGFGAWTYSQSIYTDKIRKAFIEKTPTEIKNLKNIALLSDKLVLVTGQIEATETFKSMNNKPVVLERYREEQETSKGWKEIKDSGTFKVVSFKLKMGNESVIVDPFGLDKAYIGEPQTKVEKRDNNNIKKSLWNIYSGQKVNIIGNIDNKSGILVINNPNIYKSYFDGLFNKEPFIITTMETSQAANKALEIGKSIYYSSFALFTVGVFFIFSSIGNVIKHYRQTKNNF